MGVLLPQATVYVGLLYSTGHRTQGNSPLLGCITQLFAVWALSLSGLPSGLFSLFNNLAGFL